MRWWTNLGSFALLGVGLLGFATAYRLVLHPGAWRLAGTVLLALAGAGMVAAHAMRADGRFPVRWQVTSFVLGGVAGLVQRVVMWTAAIWAAVVSGRLLGLARGARRRRPSASLGG